MTKKRRMFDIDMPADAGAEAETFPAGKAEEKPNRRGPMAAAIAETAESTRERQTVEASIRAENDASIRFHERHGFEQVGRQREVGYVRGRWADVLIMQRIFR